MGINTGYEFRKTIYTEWFPRQFSHKTVVKQFMVNVQINITEDKDTNYIDNIKQLDSLLEPAHALSSMIQNNPQIRSSLKILCEDFGSDTKKILDMSIFWSNETDCAFISPHIIYHQLRDYILNPQQNFHFQTYRAVELLFGPKIYYERFVFWLHYLASKYSLQRLHSRTGLQQIKISYPITIIIKKNVSGIIEQIDDFLASYDFDTIEFQKTSFIPKSDRNQRKFVDEITRIGKFLTISRFHGILVFFTWVGALVHVFTSLTQYDHPHFKLLSVLSAINSLLSLYVAAIICTHIEIVPIWFTWRDLIPFLIVFSRTEYAHLLSKTIFDSHNPQDINANIGNAVSIYGEKLLYNILIELLVYCLGNQFFPQIQNSWFVKIVSRICEMVVQLLIMPAILSIDIRRKEYSKYYPHMVSFVQYVMCCLNIAALPSHIHRVTHDLSADRGDRLQQWIKKNTPTSPHKSSKAEGAKTKKLSIKHQTSIIELIKLSIYIFIVFLLLIIFFSEIRCMDEECQMKTLFGTSELIKEHEKKFTNWPHSHQKYVMKVMYILINIVEPRSSDVILLPSSEYEYKSRPLIPSNHSTKTIQDRKQWFISNVAGFLFYRFFTNLRCHIFQYIAKNAIMLLIINGLLLQMCNKSVFQMLCFVKILVSRKFFYSLPEPRLPSPVKLVCTANCNRIKVNSKLSVKTTELLCKNVRHEKERFKFIVTTKSYVVGIGLANHVYLWENETLRSKTVPAIDDFIEKAPYDKITSLYFKCFSDSYQKNYARTFLLVEPKAVLKDFTKCIFDVDQETGTMCLSQKHSCLDKFHSNVWSIRAMSHLVALGCQVGTVEVYDLERMAFTHLISQEMSSSSCGVTTISFFSSFLILCGNDSGYVRSIFLKDNRSQNSCDPRKTSVCQWKLSDLPVHSLWNSSENGYCLAFDTEMNVIQILDILNVIEKCELDESSIEEGQNVHILSPFLSIKSPYRITCIFQDMTETHHPYLYWGRSDGNLCCFDISELNYHQTTKCSISAISHVDISKSYILVASKRRIIMFEKSTMTRLCHYNIPNVISLKITDDIGIVCTSDALVWLVDVAFRRIVGSLSSFTENDRSLLLRIKEKKLESNTSNKFVYRTTIAEDSTDGLLQQSCSLFSVVWSFTKIQLFLI